MFRLREQYVEYAHHVLHELAIGDLFCEPLDATLNGARAAVAIATPRLDGLACNNEAGDDPPVAFFRPEQRRDDHCIFGTIKKRPLLEVHSASGCGLRN